MATFAESDKVGLECVNRLAVHRRRQLHVEARRITACFSVSKGNDCVPVTASAIGAIEPILSDEAPDTN